MSKGRSQCWSDRTFLPTCCGCEHGANIPAQDGTFDWRCGCFNPVGRLSCHQSQTCFNGRSNARGTDMRRDRCRGRSWVLYNARLCASRGGATRKMQGAPMVSFHPLILVASPSATLPDSGFPLPTIKHVSVWRYYPCSTMSLAISDHHTSYSQVPYCLEHE